MVESFSEFMKKNKTCIELNTIKKINDQYDYEDKHPYGKGDSPEVSCGQTGYDELQYIYNEKLALPVSVGHITENEAIKALCEACKTLPNPRSRKDFYQFLSNKLGIEIK